MSEKVRENRVRRMAQRQGYMLMKSRRRDPKATDYGEYTLVTHSGLGGKGYTFGDLDEVEEWLSRQDATAGPYSLPPDEEVVQFRMKKDRWYRAVLLAGGAGNPFTNGLLSLPEKYQPSAVFVKVSHNQGSFVPAGTKFAFRLMSTNLTAEDRNGERYPIAITSSDVVLREECAGEPPLEHVGRLDLPSGGRIRLREDQDMLPS